MTFKCKIDGVDMDTSASEAAKIIKTDKFKAYADAVCQTMMNMAEDRANPLHTQSESGGCS